MAGTDDIEGDRFAAWARERMPELLGFGAVLTGSRDAAQDLVQTALARTWAAWPRVQRRDDPEGYVRRVMLNEQIGSWRRGRRRHAPIPPPPEVTDPTDGMFDRDDPVWAALMSLPPRQRAVVALRYCEDRSELETSTLLGCSVGTVKSQAAKGLARLREKLSERATERESS